MPGRILIYLSFDMFFPKMLKKLGPSLPFRDRCQILHDPVVDTADKAVLFLVVMVCLLLKNIGKF